MKDECVKMLDPASKIAVVLVDCTTAAGALARGHLSGPAAAGYLAQALAGVSLLGAECSQDEETVTLRLDCPGPLGGFLVEATAAGTLRGYTKKKVLDAFDGLGTPKDTDALGTTGTFQIIRSIPGAILSSGTVAVAFGPTAAIAQGLDAFYDQSLQRRVRNAVAGTAGDDGVPVFARGVQIECPPDGDVAAFERVADVFASGAAQKAIAGATFAPRTVLKKLGLPQAEIRQATPVAFACRCSADRAKDVIASLPAEDRAALPPTVDITCHMCGRTWTIAPTQA